MLAGLADIPSTITTPISLAALVVLVFYGVFRLLPLPQMNRVRSDDAFRLIRTAINWAGLLALVALILTLVPTSLRAVMGSSVSESTLTSTSQSALKYYKEVLVLRGDWEALEKYPNRAPNIEAEGVRLSSLLGNLSDPQLDRARRILKYEYAGWADLIVVRVASGVQTKRKHLSLAIERLQKAEALIEDARRDHARGVSEEAREVFEWATGESADLSRIRYLQAITLALDSEITGKHSNADVLDKLAQVPESYLDVWPVRSNPSLRRVLELEVTQ